MFNSIWMVSVIVVLFLSLPAISLGGMVELPRTGQTTCYDGSGAVIPCGTTGQDGATLSGAAWPSPRFKDNGDGTITDSLTGLMVLKDGNCFTAQKWGEALSTVADFNTNPGTYTCKDYTASYKDWYLPNILEIESLVNAEKPDSASWLNSQGFWEVQGVPYWSSTTDLNHFNKEARYVDMSDGAVYRDDKSTTNHKLLPVRAGQKNSPDPAYPANLWKTGQTTCYDNTGAEIPCNDTGQDGDKQAGVPWPSPRFTDNGDGTITDNLNGNIWLKDANCIATKYPSFDNDGAAGDGGVTWEHALGFVAGINSGLYADCGAGKDDWRLANRKDFISLQDASQINPVLPPGHLFMNVSQQYWTSTTMASSPDAAWSANIDEGFMLIDSKINQFPRVWPVRGGGPSNYNYLPIIFKN